MSILDHEMHMSETTLLKSKPRLKKKAIAKLPEKNTYS